MNTACSTVIGWQTARVSQHKINRLCNKYSAEETRISEHQSIPGELDYCAHTWWVGLYCAHTWWVGLYCAHTWWVGTTALIPGELDCVQWWWHFPTNDTQRHGWDTLARHRVCQHYRFETRNHPVCRTPATKSSLIIIIYSTSDTKITNEQKNYKQWC